MSIIKAIIAATAVAAAGIILFNSSYSDAYIIWLIVYIGAIHDSHL